MFVIIWLTLLLCFIWGFNWVVMKTAVDFFPPVTFSAIRFLLGSAILLLFCFYKKIPLPKKGDWKWYALCGFLQTAFVFIVNQIALQYVDAGVTSLIGFTMPFWLAVLAHYTTDEKLNVVKIAALIMGIIGLFFVLDVNPFNMQFEGYILLMQLLVLIGSIGWAVSNLVVKKVLQNRDKLQFTTYQMVIGTLILCLYSLLFERGQPIYWETTAFLLILFAGVIASSFAFVLWFYILQKWDASKASISLLLVPVIGVISGWLVLGEQITFTIVIGIILIASGIGLVNVKDDHPLVLYWRKNQGDDEVVQKPMSKGQ